MKYVCEKCGRQFDSEEECRRHEEADGRVAVRMISMWFDRDSEGCRIRVGKMFTVDRRYNMIMVSWMQAITAQTRR